MFPVISGGIGILDTLLNWSNQRDQTNATRDAYGRSLAMQQQAWDEQKRAATDPRTDPYGNQLVYTPGIGWHYNLTDQTRRTLDAEQAELLRNLTQDAAVNRDYRKRIDDISRQGSERLGGALAQKDYGPGYDEGQLIDELTRTMQINRRKGLDEGTAVLGRQALRMNQGELIPKLLQEADDLFGRSLEESILKGRQAGRSEYRAAQGFKDNQDDAAIRQALSMASANPSTGIRDPNIDDSLTNMQSGAQQGLMQSLQVPSGLSSSMMGLAGAQEPPFPLGSILKQGVSMGSNLFGSGVDENRKATALPLK